MSGRFQRPGQVKASAFGYEFSVDRDAGDSVPVSTRRPASGSALSGPHEDELSYLVEHHCVTILAAEPQVAAVHVPLCLRAAGWCRDGFQLVAVQPSAAAAASAAQEAAGVLQRPVGDVVAFAGRFQELTTLGVTEVKHTTAALLLRELLQDPLLSRYSCVLLCWNHSRTADTDLLLGLLRKILKQRPELRMVVVVDRAATSNALVRRLQAFFAAVESRGGHGAGQRLPAFMALPDRGNAVQVHYRQAPVSDFVEEAKETVLGIHRAEVPGDVIVFVPTRELVESLVNQLEQEAQTLGIRHLKDRLLPLALHTGAPFEKVQAALAPCPRGVRRVLVAMEASGVVAAVEGVVYVVDTLFRKLHAFDPFLGLSRAATVPVSATGARIRAAAAGRLRPGHCFRLCTAEAFQALDEDDVPELQRCSLAGPILQLKALGVDNIMAFPWLDPPPAESAVRGLELLYALGAVNEHARLTRAVGFKMAEMQLDPPFAAALLKAGELGCSAEVACIAAMAGVRSVWDAPVRSKAYKETILRFSAAEGDMITWLNVFKAWAEHGRSATWAKRYRLSQKALLRAADIHTHLLAALERLAVPIASAEGDVQLVIKALAAGFFMSACRFDHTEYDRLKADDRGTHVYRPIQPTRGAAPKLAIAETSVLNNVRPDVVCFGACEQASSGLWRMRDVLALSPDALHEAAPHVYQWTAQ